MCLAAALFSISHLTSTNTAHVSQLVLENAEALASGEELQASCYGPKEHVFLSGYVCRCRNTYPCKDNKGCD